MTLLSDKSFFFLSSFHQCSTFICYPCWDEH